MKRLQLEFHGICVFFSQENNPGLNLPTAYRVVVPFVRESFTWNQETIFVHEPYMWIQSGGLEMTLQPLGATVTLGDLEGQAGVQGTQQCPPHLTAIFPEMQLNEGAVIGPTPAGFYFDFNQGSMININVQGATATLLTIDTESPAAQLDFGGGVSMEVPLPARILVANTAKDSSSDFQFDFVVSFAVGEQFPPPENLVGSLNDALTETAICVGGPPSQDLGPGCSNSQFP